MLENTASIGLEAIGDYICNVKECISIDVKAEKAMVV